MYISSLTLTCRCTQQIYGTNSAEGSAVFHILFHLDKETCPDNMDVIISQDAITAATHFVEVCGQHVAFIAGRGEIDEEIKLLELGK